VDPPLVLAQRVPILELASALVAGVEWRRRPGDAAAAFGARRRRHDPVPRLQVRAQGIDVGELFAAHVADVAHAAVHLVQVQLPAGQRAEPFGVRAFLTGDVLHSKDDFNEHARISVTRIFSWAFSLGFLLVFQLENKN
jgi:hypothetical protein